MAGGFYTNVSQILSNVELAPQAASKVAEQQISLHTGLLCCNGVGSLESWQHYACCLCPTPSQH